MKRLKKKTDNCSPNLIKVYSVTPNPWHNHWFHSTQKFCFWRIPNVCGYSVALSEQFPVQAASSTFLSWGNHLGFKACWTVQRLHDKLFNWPNLISHIVAQAVWLHEPFFLIFTGREFRLLTKKMTSLGGENEMYYHSSKSELWRIAKVVWALVEIVLHFLVSVLDMFSILHYLPCHCLLK